MTFDYCVRLLLIAGVWIGVTSVAAWSAESESLHQRIDAHLATAHARQKLQPAALADDAEFVRRIYLDLHGVIPTPKQVRTFLDDRAQDKRLRLIDALLAQPEYAVHMARVFDVMLAERRVPTINSYDVTAAEWRSYLTQAFAENRPWDQIVREILTADGTDGAIKGAAKFFLSRDAAPHQLTRDVGRLFLGVDLQCAQCHDDPRFDDYRQIDYYGIYAFLQRVKVHPLQPRGAAVAESAEGKTTFTSVFTAKSGETNPRLPGGEMLADPLLEKGMEYVVKPGGKERSVPKYSRRLKLAEQLPRSETNGFARNLANRVWAVLFGRGIVHPLDLHHAANPPAHPELLQTLENWVVEQRYDIRGLIREIVQSDAYQRSSLLPKGVTDLPVESFALAKLRGLTAEQLRWSWLQATGRIELHRTRVAAAAKKSPPKTSAEPQPAWKQWLTELEPLERQSQPLLLAFATLPGNVEGDFQPIVDQALFLRNSGKLLPLLQDDPGTLVGRLKELTTATEVADELYVSVLTRRPSDDEAQQVTELLANRSPDERRAALLALQWGLLLSAEFRLNH